ncbi:MAG: SoxR reducing system RseC family protein [Dysgonamonadaceae bacterium]|jgi:sigma-E factor negative regulatory protein RseC|nr:SoxR reducing system RseC family protein [Dysgonamonadaceae bacterium]
MQNELLQGTITAVQDGILSVLINNENACAGCGSRKSCGMAGAQEKQIQVPYTSGNYKTGDKVCLASKASMGLAAVFVAFVLPLILIMAVLFLASLAGRGETFMALTVLLTMTGYYLSLYFFRDKLKQKFTFIIQ